jgi:hypothetical protein
MSELTIATLEQINFALPAQRSDQQVPTSTRLQPTDEAVRIHNAVTRKTILEQREQRRQGL